MTLARLAVLAFVFAFSATIIGSTSFRATDSSGNSPESLCLLLADLLLAAKSEDPGKLRAVIEEMEIPHYETWFARTFGQEDGRAVANQYGKYLKMNELHFEMLCTELAKQGGEISVQKVNTAKKYRTLAEPLDEYTSDWKKTDDSIGPGIQLIGEFYYVDGKFRFNGSIHSVHIISTTDADGPVKPGRLISSVQPVYPDTARRLRIQGIVAVNVIVHNDGTVTVQNVGTGHPLLAPAAVEAVRQWRYEPTTVNGKPVEIETKIYVTFAVDSKK